MNRRHNAVSLLQATQGSPGLAKLIELNGASVEMRKAIDSLIPSALRAAIKAGPIDGSMWCLIIDNNAAAAKIRQLSPSLEAHLRSNGWDVNSIRIKVQTARRY